MNRSTIHVTGISMVLFVAGCVAGYTTNGRAETTYSILENGGLSFWYVLEQNVITWFLLLSGAVLFGVTTIFVLFYNGLTFGAYMEGMVRSGYSIPDIATVTVPHLVLELPAFFVAATIALLAPYETLRYLLRFRSGLPSNEAGREALFALIVSFHALVIAARVEVSISVSMANALPGS